MDLTDAPNAPRTVPRTKIYLAAISIIFLAGALGGFTGYAVTDAGCSGSCAVPDLLGALIGTIIFGGGTGIVGVLMLRAMAEWETHASPSQRFGKASSRKSVADEIDLTKTFSGD